MGVWNADSFNADQYAQAAITVTGVGSWAGVVVRGATGAFTGYELQLFDRIGGNVSYSLDRVNAGAFASPALASGTVAWVDGDVLRLEVSGTGATVSLVMKKNGTQFGSTISDTHANRITSGSGGIATYNGTDNTAFLDDWEAGNLTAGGTTTTKVMSDTLSLSDAALDPVRRVRRSDDMLSISDAIVKSVVFGSGVFVRIMSDALGLSDDALDSSIRVRQLSDSLLVSEPGAERIFVMSRDDAIDVTDTTTRWRRLVRRPEDALTLADSIIRSVVGTGIVYAKVMSDVVILADDAGQRWKLRVRQSSDNINPTDALIRTALRLRVLGDAPVIDDGAVRITRLRRVATDALEVPDELVKLLVFDQLYSVDIRFGHSDPFRFGSGEPIAFGGQ